MARLNIAPTKSNLLNIKEQLSVAVDGYELLEQKREILVMELMHMVDRVKILERDIDKEIEIAYPTLRHMLMAIGRDQASRISQSVNYDYVIKDKTVVIAGMTFGTLEMEKPKKKLSYSFLNSFAESDKVMVEFLKLLELLTDLASIRTIVWRLAREVKKTQRRVNALDKQVIPNTKETKKYIESILEERERENIFVLKALKAKNGGSL